MKSVRRLALPVLVVVALAAACNPFTPRNTPAATPTQYPQDPRFAEFTYETDDELKVQERVDSFNERMPGLGATGGHVITAHFRLVDDNIGGSWLLPGIHPLLYEYVPEECTFTTVDPVVANKVLGTDPQAIYSDWGSFEIREFAVSAQCNLILVTGDGLNA